MRKPDVVVVHPDQVSTRAIMGVPLLAVEVLSQSSVERDVVVKRRAYARAGCAHHWLVDPEAPSIAAFEVIGPSEGEPSQLLGLKACKPAFGLVVAPKSDEGDVVEGWRCHG